VLRLMERDVSEGAAPFGQPSAEHHATSPVLLR
jgi:hypothetical protein